MLKTKETRKMWSPLRVFSPRKNHVANLSSNRKRAALERKIYIYIYIYTYINIYSVELFMEGTKMSILYLMVNVSYDYPVARERRATEIYLPYPVFPMLLSCL